MTRSIFCAVEYSNSRQFPRCFASSPPYWGTLRHALCCTAGVIARHQLTQAAVIGSRRWTLPTQTPTPHHSGQAPPSPSWIALPQRETA